MMDEILMREKIGWIFIIIMVVAVILAILVSLVRYFLQNAKWNQKTIPAIFLGCQYYINRVEVHNKDRGMMVSNHAIAKERYVMQFFNEETGEKMRFIVSDTVGRRWIAAGMQKHMPYLGTEGNAGTDAQSEQKGLLTYRGTKFIDFQKNE